MHKFFTAAPKLSGLTARPASGYPLVGLLDVPYSTPAVPDPQAGAPARLVRTAFSTPRYKNLCITRAKVIFIAVTLCATADKKYADRHFELQAKRVIFSTGGWGVTAHPIDRMEKHSENGRPFYIIYYPNEEGDEYEFSFYYDPVQDVIRFKNQEQFEWVKWNEESMDEETTDDEELTPPSPDYEQAPG
jgi:hypothetical protein